MNKCDYPNYYNAFGGGARCAGVPIPQNCSTESDEVSYNVYADWNSGYAIATVVDFGQQVSPGDSSYVGISLYCLDGSFGITYYPYADGNPGDGQPPTREVYSYCANGGAYEAVFGYGVAVTGAS